MVVLAHPVDLDVFVAVMFSCNITKCTPYININHGLLTLTCMSVNSYDGFGPPGGFGISGLHTDAAVQELL
jgi:hypothetical protein